MGHFAPPLSFPVPGARERRRREEGRSGRGWRGLGGDGGIRVEMEEEGIEGGGMNRRRKEIE